MTTLVLGGSGLIGTALGSLWRDDPSVVWLSRSQLDLSRPLESQFLPQKARAIVYLAQGRGYRQFPSAASDTFRVNVAAPLELVHRYLDHGLEQFVFASSGNAHWSRLERRVDGSVTGPDFYSATKRAAEELLFAWRDLVGVAILRIFTAYGPGADPLSMVTRLKGLVARNSELLLNGVDGDLFQPTHALDVASAVDLVVRHRWTGLADVAGPEVLSVREIAHRLAPVGTTPQFRRLDAAAADYASPGPLLASFLPGAAPRVRFPEGL